jgi:hypothetical protein
VRLLLTRARITFNGHHILTNQIEDLRPSRTSPSKASKVTVPNSMPISETPFSHSLARVHTELTGGRWDLSVGLDMDTSRWVIGGQLEVADRNSRQIIERLECNIFIQ